MEIWVVLGDCGDYYCDGQHLLGVSLTEEGADQLLAAAKVRRRLGESGASKGVDFGIFEVSVSGPYQAEELNDAEFLV